MAKWTAVRYSSNHMLDYVELADNLSVFELDVPKNWVGKTIAQLDIRKKYNINILGVMVDGKLSASIGPETTFDAQHPVLVLGSYKDVQKCFRTVSPKDPVPPVINNVAPLYTDIIT